MILALALLVVVLSASMLGVRLQRHRSLFSAPPRQLLVLFVAVSATFWGVAAAVTALGWWLAPPSRVLDIACVGMALGAIATLVVAAPVWRRQNTQGTP